MSVLIKGDVVCGFPSPGEENREDPLDFNNLLIRHSCATFCLRAYGDSMSPQIKPDDILVVDRSLGARNGDIVVAESCGDYTVKYFFKENNRFVLKPENSQYKEIEVSSDTRLFGVVTAIIRKTRK